MRARERGTCVAAALCAFCSGPPKLSTEKGATEDCQGQTTGTFGLVLLLLSTGGPDRGWSPPLGGLPWGLSGLLRIGQLLDGKGPHWGASSLGLGRQSATAIPGPNFPFPSHLRQ